MRRIDLSCCLEENAAELRLIAICFKASNSARPSFCSPALPHPRPNSHDGSFMLKIEYGALVQWLSAAY
eukprot:COSAG06_NODE_6722_length_2810_cov_1.403910_4_plen_69_part_00